MTQRSNGRIENDPRVRAALEAQTALGLAMQNLDLATVETFFASELVVHAPINAIVGRENVLARLRSGRISYEPEVERKIEFAGARGDCVIIAGEEIVRPMGDAPHAGKTIRRRFTDVWKDSRDRWQLVVRQATIVSIE